MICKWTIWFGGTSAIVGYLMQNPVYTYILNMYDLSTHFGDKNFKWAWGLFCTQINGFKYCYIRGTIQHQSFLCVHLNQYRWYIRD